MSQTTGQGGSDPENDDWLKKFRGLPSDTPTPADVDPSELHWDRPEQEKVLEQRSTNLNRFDGLPKAHGRRDPDESASAQSGFHKAIQIVIGLFAALVVYGIVKMIIG